MRQLLLYALGVLFLGAILTTAQTVQTPVTCDQQSFGPYCVNPHENPMQGYLPIGTVVTFRFTPDQPNDLIKTDIGIIVGYFWDIPSQQYEYLVTTSPIDPEAELPVMRRALVFRTEVIDAIN